MRLKSASCFCCFWLLMVLLSSFFLSACFKESKELSPSSVMNKNKIDPSILLDIERLKTAQQINEVVEVIIRTKKEITAAEKAEIERNGGKIGSIIGDIFTAKIPVHAISKIANLDLVVYIEKAKKQQLQ